jgi:UDP-N-acetylglucosamine--N-acetylmuramyl-(pentapeptide) pyrophosphoryl-undecaprenol N-acetylglucosamine transferase
MSKKIIFTTGGTGGHIFPALRLMEHFSSKGYDVLLVTDKRGNKFLENYSNLKSYALNTSTPTNKNFFNKVISFLKIFYSIIQSIKILKKEKPDLIFGFGGYVSIPISFIAKFFRIPLIIYENNMRLGRANKFLSFFSVKILLAKSIESKFSKKHKIKSLHVGPILSKNIYKYSKKIKNYKKENFSILVLGGSQGTKIFGDIIPQVIQMLKNEIKTIEVNQQCIIEQKDRISNFYEKNKIKSNVFEFEKDLAKLLSSADLAITRCGAATTAELAHTLTPFIGVPLQNSIDDHQYYNAKYYEDLGCCWVLEEDNFNTKNLFNLIIEIIKSKNKLENMCKNMKKNLSINPYNDIENEVKKIILK